MGCLAPSKSDGEVPASMVGFALGALHAGMCEWGLGRGDNVGKSSKTLLGSSSWLVPESQQLASTQADASHWPEL